MRDPRFPRILDLILMALIYLGGSILGAIPLLIIVFAQAAEGGGALDPETLANPLGNIDPAWISHLAPLMAGLPLILVAIYGWRKLGKPEWDLGFKGLPLGAVLLAIFGTLLIANGTVMVAEYLPGYDAFVDAMEQMLLPGIGMAIAIIIGAPVLEEAVFRGLILRGYLRKTEPWKAILLSGFLFGLLHILPIHVFFASIVGFALGYVYYRTRSLGLVILIHFINNGLSYLASQFDTPDTTSELTGWGPAGVLLLAFALTAAGVGLLYLLGQRYPLVAPPSGELNAPAEAPAPTASVGWGPPPADKTS